MKGGMRVAICGFILLLSTFYLLEAHLRDVCSRYRAGEYVMDWLVRNSLDHRPVLPANVVVPGDKVIVMAKLREEPTDWVQEELPEYVFESSPSPPPPSPHPYFLVQRTFQDQPASKMKALSIRTHRFNFVIFPSFLFFFFLFDVIAPM